MIEEHVVTEGCGEMKRFYRLMLGKGSVYAEYCFSESIVGADIGIEEDLTVHLPEEWREFNRAYIPVYLKDHPEASRVAAGLACGLLWTVAKGLRKGDIVLCPNGSGLYHVGEITGEYQYRPGQPLPHRRAVQWLPQIIERTAMSDELRGSTGSGAPIAEITRHRSEIERVLGTVSPLVSTDPDIEDPVAFALEKHLEDFLVKNWVLTDLGKQYDIYTVENEMVGQQYQTDTGPIDILAISKDRIRLLVVELKKGRASDAVVGQVLRYMGFVQEELAEAEQSVVGAIIALEDDQRVRRALAIVPSITFYRYRIDFKLLHA